MIMKGAAETRNWHPIILRRISSIFYAERGTLASWRKQRLASSARRFLGRGICRGEEKCKAPRRMAACVDRQKAKKSQCWRHAARTSTNQAARSENFIIYLGNLALSNTVIVYMSINRVCMLVKTTNAISCSRWRISKRWRECIVQRGVLLFSSCRRHSYTRQ